MFFVASDNSTMTANVQFFDNTTTDPKQIESLLATRVYLYTLFHKAFGGKPSAELIDALRSSDTIATLGVFAANSAAFSNLRLYCKTLSYSTIQGGFLLRANAEYTRLFDQNQPARNAANRSLYSDGGRICGVKAPHVQCLIEQHGYRCSQANARQDDHVSFLCAFAAIQAQKALEAYREGRINAFRALMIEQRSFDHDHLASWFPLFAEKVCSRGAAFMYPQMAQCLAAFVAIDEELCARIPELFESSKCSDAESEFNYAEFEMSLERIQLIRLNGLEKHEICPI